MNKNKIFNQRQRSVSAKTKFQNNQTASNQRSLKKKIVRVHTQGYDTQQRPHLSRSKLYTTSHFDYSQRIKQRTNKQPQQLVLQNFHLKIQLNELNNRLSLTKSKIQTQKKKNILYSRKLSRQFEKQLYWPEQKQNDYLITGIKYQYQCLKQKYQQKSLQMQQLRKTISNTQISQISAYCQSLQTENKILIENIYYLKKNKKSATSYFKDLKEKQESFEFLLVEERKKVQNLSKKIALLEQKASQHASTQKQLQKRINFLQKLIKQKQNNAYHANKRSKTIQKQKIKLSNQLKQLQKTIQQNQKKFKQHLEQLKNMNTRQSKIEKQTFQRNIRQKNIMIEKLEKEIGYLSTLLSYWKPLDEISRFDKMDDNASSQKQRSISVKNGPNSYHSVYNKQLMNRSKTPAHSLLIDEQNYEQITKNVGRTLNHEQLFMNRDLSLQSINNQEDQILQNKNRQPRRASKKWNQNAKKCRKVNLSQIQHIGQFMRYKLISNRVSQQSLKQFFSYKSGLTSSSSNTIPNNNSNNNISSSNNNSSIIKNIEQQFISMKQIKQIFIAKPFSLSQQESYLLSRYVIQDSQGLEFVYCHEGNELQRSIVKSIVKTLVGDYLLPQLERCQLKWKQIKKTYSHNMQLALKSICPKGLIAKDKFLELINSLGIETEEETRNYLVGKLIENENSLDKLRYDILFTEEEKIS